MCDAILQAFAAVVYARFSTENELAHVSLIMAKTRVAPLKPMNVPRLELQAALLGARLLKTVETELEIKSHKRFLWSDSMTVIQWIKGDPRTRHIFVSHRLGEINELTASSEWRWMPTKLNPADYATRWVNETIQEKHPWFVVPDFLRQDENEWPKQKILNAEERKTINAMELRKAQVFTTTTQKLSFLNISEKVGLFDWRGLLILSRRVRKAADRWRKITGRSYDDKSYIEEFCIRTIQAESFCEEINRFREKKELSKKSKILTLRPFIDSKGLIR